MTVVDVRSLGARRRAQVRAQSDERASVVGDIASASEALDREASPRAERRSLAGLCALATRGTLRGRRGVSHRFDCRRAVRVRAVPGMAAAWFT